MDKSVDDQIHEGINVQRNKCTKRQSRQPFNKMCYNTPYSMYVHKLIAHWTGWEVLVIDIFLQGWVSSIRCIPNILGGVWVSWLWKCDNYWSKVTIELANLADIHRN
jgi:hypothetical protein